MPNFVQYGKVGKPIVYNTLPTASEDLKGVCGQIEDKIYICDGSNWNLFSNTTLKKLLDATQNCHYLFENYQGTSVDDFITYNDTSNVNDMRNMFSYCSKLLSIPLLNTSNVIQMSKMCFNCRALTSIPQFDTSKVVDMGSMLSLCVKLTTVPLLDTSKAVSLRSMFSSCIALTTVPALNVSNVTDMDNIFSNCPSLKSILMTGMKVKFDISASTQFERADLVTILNNLATVTTTQTLTMGADNLAKLTDEDKAIATNKGWTLA